MEKSLQRPYKKQFSNQMKRTIVYIKPSLGGGKFHNNLPQNPTIMSLREYGDTLNTDTPMGVLTTNNLEIPIPPSPMSSGNTTPLQSDSEVETMKKYKPENHKIYTIFKISKKDKYYYERLRSIINSHFYMNMEALINLLAIN
jgi:hypothetical protein